MTAPARKAPLKAADSTPFDFNLDAVEAEVDLTPWRVHYAGKRWVFKHPQEIDVWDVVAADENNDGSSEMGGMLAVFKVALGEASFKEFRKVPLPNFKLKALFEAYQKFGGVEPGESEGSTAS